MMEDQTCQGIVLLKHDENILPLSKDISSIAVIGPNANVTSTLLSNYFGQRCHGGGYDCILTPLNAIKNVVSNVKYDQGCDINSNDKSRFSNAINIAKISEVVIMFVGIDNSIESEGQDREEITLPGVQDDLFQEIIKVNKKTIVVLINGNALAIENIQQNAKAIIEAFYPGENGAQAISNVLFGDCNPSGKLPYTIFPKDYVNQLPLTDMTMSFDVNKYYPGRTYRYFIDLPLWSFGFGMSYTTFDITWDDSDMIMESQSEGPIYFEANVTNIGQVAGSEVVMVFIEFKNDPKNELKRLFGFEKVFLQPNESKKVFITAELKSLGTVNDNGDNILIPGTKRILLTNGNNISLWKNLIINGKQKILHKMKNNK